MSANVPTPSAEKVIEILKNRFCNGNPTIVHCEIYKHNGNDYPLIIFEYNNGYDAGVFFGNKWHVFYKTSENDTDDFMRYKLENDNTFITNMMEKVKNGISEKLK